MASTHSPSRRVCGDTNAGFSPKSCYRRRAFSSSSNDLPCRPILRTGTTGSPNGKKPVTSLPQPSTRISHRRPVAPDSRSPLQVQELPPLHAASSPPPCPTSLSLRPESEAFSFPSLVPSPRRSTTIFGTYYLPRSFFEEEIAPLVHRYTDLPQTLLFPDEGERVDHPAVPAAQVPSLRLKSAIERFEAQNCSYMKAKLAVLFSEEALTKRQRSKGSQKKLFRAEGQRCMGTPRPTRARGALSPGVPPSVGRGMESAYEHALIRLEATNSPYLRQKIAGLYTEKETERRRKSGGERHTEKNEEGGREEKATDVASPRSIGAITGPVTRTERDSRDLELPNSGNEASGNCVDGPLEEGRSRRRGQEEGGREVTV